MEYGKVFKKVYNQEHTFKLAPYDSATFNYSTLIKNQKQSGYRQVLFNSELMIELITAIDVYPDIYLKKIEMCNDTGKEHQNELNDLVLEFRTNREVLFRIIDELEWYSDKESIDVSKIHFYNKQTATTTVLQTNGIIYGNEINLFFEQFVSPQLMRYFDGE